MKAVQQDSVLDAFTDYENNEIILSYNYFRPCVRKAQTDE